MSITIEQIDMLRERSNASYQDAKEALEKTNGDIVDALVYLEKDNKIKINSRKNCEGRFAEKVKHILKKGNGEGRFAEKVKHILKKGNETKFIITKDNHHVINISVTVAIIIGVVATPVVVIGIPVALLTKHKIKVESINSDNSKVNQIFNTISDKVNTMADMLSKECQK